MQLGCRTNSSYNNVESLASNMAEMEQYMNILFRYIDNPDRINDMKLATTRLLSLQIDSAKFSPPHINDGQALYLERTQQSIDIIHILNSKLSEGNLKEAKEQLHILDRHRRKCHSLFG